MERGRMKLLLVSDEASSYIWDYFDPEVFRGVELILSCGDLSEEYLNFLVTMIPAPLFYVPGNHDRHFLKRPPEGCQSLDGRVLTIQGLRLAGLGGCKSHRQEAFEYTEPSMRRRVSSLSRLIRRQGGLDIFVSHVSALGLGDGEDIYHQGFACYQGLLDEFLPQYHVFGHQHKGYCHRTGPEMYKETRLINACGYKFLEF